ncbi:MAG: hypothetical protein RLY43_651 [Bacteroidota bacterium]|jgi:hypothetical protein
MLGCVRRGFRGRFMFGFKCFHFPTWEEKKESYVKSDNSELVFLIEEKYNIMRTKNPHYNVFDKNNKDEYCEIYSIRMNIDKIQLSIPTDPILDECQNKIDNIDCGICEICSKRTLTELCEKVGAAMYGDYIVFENHLGVDWTGYSGDFRYVVDSCGEFEQWKNPYPTEFESCNLFHEYSKFLRKKESKWEEVKVILGFNL